MGVLQIKLRGKPAINVKDVYYSADVTANVLLRSLLAATGDWELGADKSFHKPSDTTFYSTGRLPGFTVHHWLTPPLNREPDWDDDIAFIRIDNPNPTDSPQKSTPEEPVSRGRARRGRGRGGKVSSQPRKTKATRADSSDISNGVAQMTLDENIEYGDDGWPSWPPGKPSSQSASVEYTGIAVVQNEESNEADGNNCWPAWLPPNRPASSQTSVPRVARTGLAQVQTFDDELNEVDDFDIPRVAYTGFAQVIAADESKSNRAAEFDVPRVAYTGLAQVVSYDESESNEFSDIKPQSRRAMDRSASSGPRVSDMNRRSRGSIGRPPSSGTTRVARTGVAQVMSPDPDPYNTRPRRTIDDYKYPHIISRIFKYATLPALLRLRGVSRAYRRRADEMMLGHVELSLSAHPNLSTRVDSHRAGRKLMSRGPRFGVPICFDGSNGVPWDRLFDYDQMSDNEDSDEEKDSDGYPSDFWDSDHDGLIWSENTKDSTQNVAEFLGKLERSDRDALDLVRTLDLRARWLDQDTMTRISKLFRNATHLRLLSKYECDTIEPYVLIRSPAENFVVFTRPDNGDIDIPPVSRNVTRAMYSIVLNPTDTNLLLQPEGYGYPDSVRTIVLLFNPSTKMPLSPPRSNERHPFLERQFPLAPGAPPLPPTPMFEHMVNDILENLPRMNFIIVGLLDLDPQLYGVGPVAQTRVQRKNALIKLLQKQAPLYSHEVRNFLSQAAWIKDIPRHLTFMTREEYEASISPEQWALETVS